MTMPTAMRLKEYPEWLYLLQEFDALYRHGSAGGSPAIRGHRKRVRDRLSAAVASNAEIVARPCDTKPVIAHLPRALDLGERAAMQGMARALREVQGRDVAAHRGLRGVGQGDQLGHRDHRLLLHRGKDDSLAFPFVHRLLRPHR